MNPHGCLAQKSGLVISPLFGVTPHYLCKMAAITKCRHFIKWKKKKGSAEILSLTYNLSVSMQFSRQIENYVSDYKASLLGASELLTM